MAITLRPRVERSQTVTDAGIYILDLKIAAWVLTFIDARSQTVAALFSEIGIQWICIQTEALFTPCQSVKTYLLLLHHCRMVALSFRPLDRKVHPAITHTPQLFNKNGPSNDFNIEPKTTTKYESLIQRYITP